MSSYYFIGQTVTQANASFSNATFTGNTTISGGSVTITGGPLTLNNGTVDTSGFIIPNKIDPPTYYFAYDWDWVSVAAAFAQNGNVVIAANNSVSAPLALASTQGVGYVNTSTTTAGGFCSLPSSCFVVKSTAINYQWRELFYMPAASSPTNRYTAFIGAFVATGLANNSNPGPVIGPYLAYSDNLNGGNWVMGNGVNGTRTTVNSLTAPTTNAWNILMITLANGVFTYTVNNVVIGTVTDANILTTPQNGQGASAGGMMIIPDGTNFTTQATLMLDRSDYYVTGLTR